MSQSPPTPPSLVEKLANSSDADAWQEFQALYEPLILRFALRYGLQESDAWDICQEVHAAVARDVEKFEADGKPAAFRRWLFTIARNRICGFLIERRKQKLVTGGTDLHQTMNQVPDTQGAGDESIESEYRRQLLVQVGHRVRREFQETTWLAFWKTAVEGHPAKDVARALNLSVGSVHTAKCRVIKRLGEGIRRIEGTLD